MTRYRSLFRRLLSADDKAVSSHGDEGAAAATGKSSQTGE